MTAPDLILHGGKIVSVGAASALRKAASPATQSLDLRGRSVLPGLFDGHPHVDREGLRACGGVSLASLTSVAEIVEQARQAASRARPGDWIVMMPMGSPPHGFISRPDQLREGRFPTRHDLDAVSPENPVYIRAVSGWWSHRPFPSVANSMALRLAGVTSATPAPYNCEILKDSHGEPNGVFLERNFVPILEYKALLREWAYAVPYPASAHRTAALARWLHHYNWHRLHSALTHQPPISRVLTQDDLLRLHS